MSLAFAIVIRRQLEQHAFAQAAAPDAQRSPQSPGGRLKNQNTGR
jgi:hypothetical protein